MLVVVGGGGVGGLDGPATPMFGNDWEYSIDSSGQAMVAARGVFLSLPPHLAGAHAGKGER